MSYAVFDHIPEVREMLKHNGIPGVEYAIVVLENLLKAHSEKPRWEELSPPTLPFAIQGPKGQAPCKLLGRGKPIKGQQPGIVSPLQVDKKVREITGLVEPKSEK